MATAMKTQPKTIQSKAEAKKKPFCEVCGRSSSELICDACADRIRAAAVARKSRENKGIE